MMSIVHRLSETDSLQLKVTLLTHYCSIVYFSFLWLSICYRSCIFHSCIFSAPVRTDALSNPAINCTAVQ